MRGAQGTRFPPGRTARAQADLGGVGKFRRSDRDAGRPEPVRQQPRQRVGAGRSRILRIRAVPRHRPGDRL